MSQQKGPTLPGFKVSGTPGHNNSTSRRLPTRNKDMSGVTVSAILGTNCPGKCLCVRGGQTATLGVRGEAGPQGPWVFLDETWQRPRAQSVIRFEWR